MANRVTHTHDCLQCRRNEPCACPECRTLPDRLCLDCMERAWLHGRKNARSRRRTSPTLKAA